jgi:hypothetical protein
MRWFEFTMAPQKLALVADEKQGTVDGTSRATIKFDHPDYYIDVRSAGRSTQPICNRAGNFDCIS